MAHDVAAGPPKGKLVIRNIGLLLSGDLNKPILDADTIVVVDGRIAAIGRAEAQRNRWGNWALWVIAGLLAWAVLG